MSKVYQELLNTPEWRDIRGRVISRDGNKCQKCNNRKIVDLLCIAVACGYKPLQNNEHFISIFYDDDIFWVEKGRDRINDLKTIYLINEEAKPNGMFINYVAKVEWDGLIMSTNITPRIAIEKANEYLANNNLLTRNWKEVKGLHVHHTYYQQGRRPWEYPSEDLITLCGDCHAEVHRTCKIPIKDKNGYLLAEDYLNVCWKCKGLGFLPEYYYHIGGVCFACNGSRYV